MPKLMAVAIVTACVMGAVTYMLTKSVVAGALVAVIVTLSDYVGLKMVIARIEPHLPPEDWPNNG